MFWRTKASAVPLNHILSLAVGSYYSQREERRRRKRDSWCEETQHGNCDWIQNGRRHSVHSKTCYQCVSTRNSHKTISISKKSKREIFISFEVSICCIYSLFLWNSRKKNRQLILHHKDISSTQMLSGMRIYLPLIKQQVNDGGELNLFDNNRANHFCGCYYSQVKDQCRNGQCSMSMNIFIICKCTPEVHTSTVKQQLHLMPKLPVLPGNI